MLPKITKGGSFHDHRGSLGFNNDFDLSEVKRIYTIENEDVDVVRAWQGHQIEKRWFTAVLGSFLIRLIKLDDLKKPSRQLQSQDFEISAEKLDVLHIPSGYVSSIQALEEGSKLLVMADYHLGEVQDELRFEPDYFS